MKEEDPSLKKVAVELFKMQPDALVEFFEIDFSNLQEDFRELEEKYGKPLGVSAGAETVYRFTSNINGSNPLYWQGKGYQPLPIETSDFESPSDGRLPRPKLVIANPSGLLSSIVAVNHDFHGCKVTRKRTFVKFLDDQNFPANSFQYKDVDGNPVDVVRNRAQDSSGNVVVGSNPFGKADPNAHLPDDVYYINRKVMDSKTSIEFEMTSILEIGDLRFPDRQILADYCGFRYRDSNSCGYKGLPVKGPNGQRFSLYGIYELTFINSSGSRVRLTDSNMNIVPFWDSSIQYEKGDVVRLPVGRHPSVESYYVCIKKPKVPCPSPSSSEEIWVLDACQKDLSSCICHFGKEASGKKGMNFGGFPSTQGAKFS